LEESKLRTTILGLLPSDGTPIRWRELKDRASERKLSQSTLSIYLKKFVADGSVKRHVDSDAHPPKVVYRVTSMGTTHLLRDPIVKRIQRASGITGAQFQVKIGE
jgi:DNA-binding HxlR family transcriptional regulator